MRGGEAKPGRRKKRDEAPAEKGETGTDDGASSNGGGESGADSGSCSTWYMVSRCSSRTATLNVTSRIYGGEGWSDMATR